MGMDIADLAGRKAGIFQRNLLHRLHDTMLLRLLGRWDIIGLAFRFAAIIKMVGLVPTILMIALFEATLQQALQCLAVSAFCNNQLDRALFQRIILIQVDMGILRDFILCQSKADTCQGFQAFSIGFNQKGIVVFCAGDFKSVNPSQADTVIVGLNFDINFYNYHILPIKCGIGREQAPALLGYLT